jgi:type II secretory pathway pseudopilin PulG
VQFQFRESFHIIISLIVTAVLLTVCVVFTNEARVAENQERDIRALAAELREVRYWKTYEGAKTGADVADFIVRHKDMCDIIIRDAVLASNPQVRDYLTGGTLIMGLSDRRNIPDHFWHVSFVYRHIIDGDGKKTYTATLLYDGQLAPEYGVGGVQSRGGAVTGIEFRAT